MSGENAQRIVMGRVAAPFGVKGWVKIQTFTQTLDSLLDYTDWQIGKNDQWQDAKIEESTAQGGFIVAKFVGCNDRDAAFALRGQEIAVNRKELPAPKEGEYYWEDLIGLAVFNRDNVELGKVAKLMETGAHDVLVIQGVATDDGTARKEILIPFVGVFVLNVDLAQGRIEVDWGLDY